MKLGDIEVSTWMVCETLVIWSVREVHEESKLSESRLIFSNLNSN